MTLLLSCPALAAWTGSKSNVNSRPQKVHQSERIGLREIKRVLGNGALKLRNSRKNGPALLTAEAYDPSRPGDVLFCTIYRSGPQTGMIKEIKNAEQTVLYRKTKPKRQLGKSLVLLTKQAESQARLLFESPDVKLQNPRALNAAIFSADVSLSTFPGEVWSARIFRSGGTPGTIDEIRDSSGKVVYERKWAPLLQTALNELRTRLQNPRLNLWYPQVLGRSKMAAVAYDSQNLATRHQIEISRHGVSAGRIVRIIDSTGKEFDFLGERGLIAKLKASELTLLNQSQAILREKLEVPDLILHPPSGKTRLRLTVPASSPSHPDERYTVTLYRNLVGTAAIGEVRSANNTLVYSRKTERLLQTAVKEVRKRLGNPNLTLMNPTVVNLRYATAEAHDRDGREIYRVILHRRSTLMGVVEQIELGKKVLYSRTASRRQKQADVQM